MDISPILQVKGRKNNRDSKPWVDPVAGLLVSIVALSLFAWFSSSETHRDFSQTVISDAFEPLLPFWTDSDFSSATLSAPTVPVYPYSVIPGGVASAKQLQAALHNDPVVAAHYTGFHTSSAHVIRLKKDRQAYVSYRLGNRVYWTRREITLHAGEKLLTDGTHFARTRCGNRVSEVPAQPTAPSEPTGEVFDRPVFAYDPGETTDNVLPGPIWADRPTPLLLALNGTPPANVPVGTVPFLPPTPICCGSPSHHSPATSPLPQPIPVPPLPIEATPEPRSLVLLVLGLSGLVALWKFRRP